MVLVMVLVLVLVVLVLVLVLVVTCQPEAAIHPVGKTSAIVERRRKSVRVLS